MTMMQASPHFRSSAALLIAAAAALWSASPAPAHAQHSHNHKAHVHGNATLNVAVQGNVLSVQLEAPLDSLLGFEHRPRTPAQRQAADAVIQKLNDVPGWLRPAAAGGCTLTRTELDTEALRPLQPGAKDNEHADLEANIEFSCSAPDKLASLELGLFEAFRRMNRIDVQVAAAQGQRKQTLRRPANVVQLQR